MEIDFSKEELVTISNAINEALEIKDPEFQTRMGITREEVLQLLNKVKAFLEK